MFSFKISTGLFKLICTFFFESISCNLTFYNLEHCARYYEGYQGKEAEPYEILIEYYKDADREKAVCIAESAIQRCKIDQTSFFLFLLQDAKDNGDEQRFKKLMQSARRRKAVNMEKIREKHR